MKYMIDTPSPFASEEELDAFLREMATLDQDAPEVQAAIAEANGYLAERKKD